jgi:hypothetical protein
MVGASSDSPDVARVVANGPDAGTSRDRALGFGDDLALTGRVERPRRVLNRRVDTGTPAATGARYPRPELSSPHRSVARRLELGQFHFYGSFPI